MSFKRELANNERYFKANGDDILQLDTSITAYEVYIELGRDKDGNTIKNKDGSDRYFPIDDDSIVLVKEDIEVKKVRDGVYKNIYVIDTDKVERVDRDGKRVYYVVDPDKLTTLTKGTKVVNTKSGLIKVVDTMGMAIVDDTDMDHERVISIRAFKTDDHKKEAEDTLKNFSYRHHRN